MAKPAEMLREMDARDTPAHAEVEMRDAAALLDECERVLKRAEAHYRILPEDMDEPGSVMHDMTTVLAKLRGEQ